MPTTIHAPPRPREVAACGRSARSARAGGHQAQVRVVLERRRDRALDLRRAPARRACGTSLSERPSASVMNAWASSPSGKDPASQAPHTTPPAAPEKPTRCSCSPQLAQAPSCGARPAASSSFRRNASAPARAAAGARSPGLLVEQRELAAQQVEDAGMGLGGLEQPPDRVARPRSRVQRAGVPAQARVRVDRLRARHRQQLAAALVQLDAAGGRTAPGARRSGCARAARPSRSRSPARGAGV